MPAIISSGSVAAHFAWRRVLRRPSTGLFAAIGIALAIAAVVAGSGVPLLAGDATLREEVSKLPADERAITFSASVDLLDSIDELSAVDRVIHSRLPASGAFGVRAQVAYRSLATPDGAVYRLAGFDDLVENTALIDGRLPTTCIPERCEVAIADASATLSLPASLGIDIVGRVAITNPTLLSGQFAAEPGETLLVAPGWVAVSELTSLALIGRSVGWVAPLDTARLRLDNSDALRSSVARTAAAIELQSVQVAFPTDSFDAARVRAKVAQNRVVLATIQGAVLLAGFAVLAAAARRYEHAEARSLLRQRGATSGQLAFFTAAEMLWPTVVGVLAGVPAGLTITSVLAKRWGSARPGLAAETADAAARPVLLAAAALFAVTFLVSSRPVPLNGRETSQRGWGWPDGVGLAALAAGLVGLSRGATNAGQLANRSDPLVVALPVVSCVVTAWVAIRIVPRIAHILRRLLLRRAHLGRVALSEITRARPVPLTALAFLAATTLFGLFSLSYRTTLLAGAQDQARFVVPFDLTVRTGPSLIRPTALRPTAGWNSVAPGVIASEIVRRAVAVRSPNLYVDAIELIGLDPDALAEGPNWSGGVAPPPRSLAATIRTTGPEQVGALISGSATELTISVIGDRADVDAVVERRDGSWHEVAALVRADDPSRRYVALEPGDAGGRLVGFRIAQPIDDAARSEHRFGEGDTATTEFGAKVTIADVVESNLSAPNSKVSISTPWEALASESAELSVSATSVTVVVRAQGASALILARGQRSARLVPAIVDPYTATAAINGVLTVEVGGGDQIDVAVARVVTRFPGASERFVVADLASAQRLLDESDPGFGTPNEVWIAASNGDQRSLSAAFEEAPFDQLRVQSRVSAESSLRAEPISRMTLGIFGFAAVVAALLAIAALVLTTHSEVVQQRPLHRSLATEGVSVAKIRRMVMVELAAILAAALIVGAGGALVLLSVASRVISVTAAAANPVPPLVTRVPWALSALLVALIWGIAMAGVRLACRPIARVVHGDLLRGVE